MPFLEKHLHIKKSTLPSAGKGLFTKINITKGTRIAEYKGKITTWKIVLETEAKTKIFNRYFYYITENHVIDGEPDKKLLGRYANDANGVTKVKGVYNNCRYVKDGLKVFMEAVKDIPAGSEILISYGKDYWDKLKGLEV